MFDNQRRDRGGARTSVSRRLCSNWAESKFERLLVVRRIEDRWHLRVSLSSRFCGEYDRRDGGMKQQDVPNSRWEIEITSNPLVPSSTRFPPFKESSVAQNSASLAKSSKLHLQARSPMSLVLFHRERGRSRLAIWCKVKSTCLFTVLLCYGTLPLETLTNVFYYYLFHPITIYANE